MSQYIFEPKVLEEHISMLGKNWKRTLGRVIHAYLLEAPEILERMRKNIVLKNIEEIRNAAHTLKSSAAAIGAVSDSELCAYIEKHTQTGNLAHIQGRVEDLEKQHQNTVLQLNEFKLKWTLE